MKNARRASPPSDTYREWRSEEGALFVVFLFGFQIKLGETEQKIITFVATTFEAVISVSEANERLAGRKFYSRGIYYRLNVFLHTQFLSQK